MFRHILTRIPLITKVNLLEESIYFCFYRTKSTFNKDISNNNHKNNNNNSGLNKVENNQKKIPKMDTSVFHRYEEITDNPEGLFRGYVDRFNGITIDSELEKHTEGDFMQKLQNSLKFWKESNRRGIWFKVHKENSDWIPYLTKEGFDFHHAKNDYVVLLKWLPEGEDPNVPQYAHTLIGVGGLVMNEDKILVVSEKNALIPNSWKLPGGYVEPKENFIDAAKREVEEETGIKTEFETVVSLRHTHHGGFGCSDLYVVIGLKPISSELNRSEREIAKLEWMPVNEYLNHPNVHLTNKEFVKKYLEYREKNIRIISEEGLHPRLKIPFTLYSVKFKNCNDF